MDRGTTRSNAVAKQQYTAAKTRTQGRAAWAIAFRHPARPDPRTNSGLKIRRGLGKIDDAEADRLVAEMNQLLADETWWNVTQRDRAARQFAPVVVSAFYDPLEPEVQDTSAIREAEIPMPDKSEGYVRVQFVGTTGAGKTTLLRHIIGSDPKTDRFPSTSTARTTIADIEVITGSAPYEAVVTFFDEWRVHTSVVECLVEAGNCVWGGLEDDKIADRLLHHSDQKFRLSYILGSWKPSVASSDSNDDWSMLPDNVPAEPSIDEDGAISIEDARKCQAFLEAVVVRVKDSASAVIKHMTDQFGVDVTDPTGPDHEVYQDIFESEYESSADFDDIVKDILDEIRHRFENIHGNLQRRKSRWPESWHVSSENRDDFVRQIRWFSSNDAKAYGRLLTPLVDGIRVKGPLYPKISDRRDKLVLIDGQGLGHTPDSSASVTTHVTERFGSVDVILLVDSAEQPVQAAPLTAIRAILSSGHQRKLAVAFTHFDNVKGDNLPGPREKRAHVMASVRNGITSFKDMGQIAVAALQRGMDDRCFMLGYLDHPSESLPKGFVGEFERLLEFFQRSIAVRETLDLKPHYDMAGVSFAVREAAEDFNKRWTRLLGTGDGYGPKKEHWTRIKALTRRFAQQGDVEYDTLRPVADLVKRLEESILQFLERPLDWSRRPKNEEEAEAVLSAIRQQVSAGMHDLSRTRIADLHLAEWVEAYRHRGQGSTFVRAREVMNIYDAAAPIPGTVVDRIAVDFLREVRQIVRKSIEDSGGIIESR
jgi:hypothetical protein